VFLVPIYFYTQKMARDCLGDAHCAVVLVAWQIFERFGQEHSGNRRGRLHAVLRLAGLAQKLKSACIDGHLGWIVFPSLWLPPWRDPLRHRSGFLRFESFILGLHRRGRGILICVQELARFFSQWALIFFAGSVSFFFAGRLGICCHGAAIAILATRRWAALDPSCHRLRAGA